MLSFVSRRTAAAAVQAARKPAFAFVRAASSESRIVRFQSEDGEEHFGVFTDVTEAKCKVAKRGPTGKMSISDEVKNVDIILPPVDPPAIFCVGLNYADHAAEVKMEAGKYPLLFSKPVTSLTGHNCAIVIPSVAKDEVDYEAELAVIIGREGKNIPEERAMEYVLGYTVVNDVTARKWQGKKGGGQFLRGKGFDTFLPMGPFLVPKSDVPDPHNLRIRTVVNGETVQDSNTNQMLFKIPELIAFISQGTTLLPGTVICTGTPAGVGYTKGKYLKRGDVVSITIDGVGTLLNQVAEEMEGGLIEH